MAVIKSTMIVMFKVLRIKYKDEEEVKSTKVFFLILKKNRTTYYLKLNALSWKKLKSRSKWMENLHQFFEKISKYQNDINLPKLCGE